MPVALITGASRGFGRALTQVLAQRGWSLVIDARTAPDLQAVERSLAVPVTAVPGDVTDARHRDDLAKAVARAGRCDLLVNNASLLGPSPQPGLAEYPLDELRRVYETDVLAPLALVQRLLPLAAAGAAIVNLSSDAAVEAYAGWGATGRPRPRSTT